MTSRLLITGARGQIGHEIAILGRSLGLDIIAVDHAGLDIRDATAVRSTIETRVPDLIVNAAAYTAVDQAESDTEAAYAVNRDGAGNVAIAAAAAGIPLIHYSTDYVFDGTKNGAWNENDPRTPISVYGASKAAGEDAVRRALDAHVIIRTAWVYSAHGHNFVRTMLRLGAERDELRIVDDQHGNPTSALDLARVTLAVAKVLLAGSTTYGIFHYAGCGATTWFRFAREIFLLAEPALGRRPKLLPITSAQYPTAARRPANSALDCHKILDRFGIGTSPWQESLAEVIEAVGRTQDSRGEK